MALIALPDCGKRALVPVWGLLALLIAATAQAEIFKCTDSSGKIAFSDKPCANAQKSENIEIHAVTIQAQHTTESAADYEKRRQQVREKNQESRRKIDEAKAEVRKIKSDNYDPEKCRSARARMEDMKRRNPITYNLDVSYFEFQQRASLYCGN